METIFQIGQYVCIPPYGGTPMRVMSIKGDQIECHWMDAKRRSQTKFFTQRPLNRSSALGR